MAEQIHFSSYVLKDIAENMAKAHWDWCDCQYYTNVGFDWGNKEYQRDDWRLYVGRYWFKRKAYLTRGRNTTIELTKVQSDNLIQAWDELEVRRLEIQAEEKATAKAQLDKDQWWP